MPSSPTENLRARLIQIGEPARLFEELFVNAPIGFQVYEPSGRCLFVNAAFIELFGSAPPAEYNLFEDTVLAKRGIVDLIKRAFTGERMTIPPHWYDIRELRNLPPGTDVSSGRRILIGAEMMPLRGAQNQVTHVLIAFADHTAAWEAREEAERAARIAERARFAADVRATHNEFLAKAAQLLASASDLDQTLRSVAVLATETFSDMCAIDLVNEDGTLRRVASLHRDPMRQSLVDDLQKIHQPHINSPAVKVIKTGKPELVAELDADYTATHSSSPAHEALIKSLQLRSAIVFPLRTGDRTVGAISLGYTDGTGRYSESDMPLVEALASHAAVAIENARLFRAVEEARREAEGANRAKDEFLAILGHELRNPLAPIVTALEVARKRDGASHERSIIERNVDHLRRLVDDLLDVSRIAKGSLDLHTTTFEIADVVMEGFELARAQIEQRNHQVSIDVPRGLVIPGDRVRLAQVVANLLLNAARYTDPGGRITIVGSRSANDIVLRVRDTGVGMAPDLIPHVFETFVRGSRGGGLGLGLAIVKSITELHGGRVTARSEGVGRGSELEVVLPIRDVAVPRTKTPSVVPPSPQPGSRELGIILIVDDNTDAAQLLGDALETYGFKTIVSHSPRAALEAARHHVPSIALIDIGLPEMDGYELALLLRAGNPKLHCVALTGYSQHSDRERATDAGFAEHLIKPIKLPALIPLLDKLLAS